MRRGMRYMHERTLWVEHDGSSGWNEVDVCLCHLLYTSNVGNQWLFSILTDDHNDRDSEEDVTDQGFVVNGQTVWEPVSDTILIPYYVRKTAVWTPAQCVCPFAWRIECLLCFAIRKWVSRFCMRWYWLIWAFPWTLFQLLSAFIGLPRLREFWCKTFLGTCQRVNDRILILGPGVSSWHHAGSDPPPPNPILCTTDRSYGSCPMTKIKT